MVNFASAAPRVSLPLFAAVLGASLVLGACNLGAATPQDDDSAGGGPYATSQQSIAGVGSGEQEWALADCSDGPYSLTAAHTFRMTVSGTEVHISTHGTVPLNVDKDSGTVTSGAGKGPGYLSGSDDDGCEFFASWDYSATVSGTCNGNEMHLEIVEIFGKGGAISGKMTCPDDEPQSFSMGWPAMTHEQDFQLLSYPTVDPRRISWGTGGTGYKEWAVIMGGPPEVPLVPLVQP